MDFSIVFFAFTICWKMTWCSRPLRCYKCEPQWSSERATEPLCEIFDYTDRFITDCPYSTICFKKETILLSLGSQTKTIERGCAPQTWDGEQENYGGKWHHVKNIHEKYNETCEDNSAEADQVTKTTKCYCRGDLCNGAGGVHNTLGLICSLILLLAMK